MPRSIKTIFKTHLQTNVTLDKDTLSAIVEEVLLVNTSEHNLRLRSLLQQKEKLDQEIKSVTQTIHDVRKESFFQIENELITHFGEITPRSQKQLTQLKLQSIDILDALREITESAYISALESSENLEATLQEIARDLTHKTLRDGYLTLERAKHVVGTIVAMATEIAEAAPNHSGEILRATLYGTKKGLTQSIELFKQRFSYIPDELRPMQIQNMKQTVKDLRQTDTLFIEVINEEAKQASALMQKELLYIAERMRPDLSDLIGASKEALNLVSETLSNVSKEALQKGQTVLKSNAAIEAKRMGVNVWAVAKSALNGAISSAKDALDNTKNSKK